jgi:hypothetical protein
MGMMKKERLFSVMTPSKYLKGSQLKNSSENLTEQELRRFEGIQKKTTKRKAKYTYSIYIIFIVLLQEKN